MALDVQFMTYLATLIELVNSNENVRCLRSGNKSVICGPFQTDGPVADRINRMNDHEQRDLRERMKACSRSIFGSDVQSSLTLTLTVLNLGFSGLYWPSPSFSCYFYTNHSYGTGLHLTASRITVYSVSFMVQLYEEAQRYQISLDSRR